jgi:hypothetical protein
MTSEESPYDDLDALVEDAFDDVETDLADENGWGDSVTESALLPPGKVPGAAMMSSRDAWTRRAEARAYSLA